MRIGIYDLNIRKARILGFAVLSSVTLGACVAGEGFSFAPEVSENSEGQQLGPVVPKSNHATLARGTIKLRAPQGYCVDETSISNGLQGSSVMLASCTSLDGKGAGSGAAVMSVQISPRRGSDATAPKIADLVASLAPHAVLKTQQKGDLALVQVATGADKVFSPADPVHWRGATSLDTRLVLLGLFAPNGSRLKSDAGADLLTNLARGLSANRGSLLGATSDPSENSVEGDINEQPKDVPENLTPDTVEAEKKGAASFIGRLLNRS